MIRPGRPRTRWMMAVTLLACAACGSDPSRTPEPTDSPAPALDPAARSGPVGKIVGVTGPGGVTSDQLPEGTFLGKGAALEPGQRISTPTGTFAELQLSQGGTVRLNENSALLTTDPPRLIRGEAVIVNRASDHRAAVGLRPQDPSPDRRVILGVGQDTVGVHNGELQVRTRDDQQSYAVVYGNATITSAGRELALQTGETIDTPLPPAESQPTPTLRLSALEDTRWARTFDAAGHAAADVPRGIGSLTARRAGTTAERQPLRLTDQKVTVNIAGRVAHTQIEQAFHNDKPFVLEGIYRFPLPSDGSISDLQLLVGKTWMQGEIVEKQRARAIFKQIVDATVPRDPALLEWERGNIFKLRIFPIPGRGERRVRLAYTQVLPVVGDRVRYRFPLGGNGTTDSSIDNFSLAINIDRTELEDEHLPDIQTPMLELERTLSRDMIELTTRRKDFLPTFDLGVDIPVPQAAHKVHTTTHLDRDGQAYFMASLRPELDLGRDPRPVDYAFVLDRSHSTTPQLWAASQSLVGAMAQIMDDDDQATVLACDTACDEHPGGLVASANTEAAMAFLKRQQLAGASDIGGMLIEAADALRRSQRDARKVIVYLGDGSPSSGEMAADQLAMLLAEPLRDATVLAVAMGARADLTTLGAVVSTTGGDLVRADPRDDFATVVRDLRLRAEVPMARNVEFDLPEGMAVVRRHGASSIRSGDSVVLTGKLRHAVSGDITMRARGPKGVVEQVFAVDLSAQPEPSRALGRHLPRTWAQMEIEHLTQTRGFDARDEIIGLSKDYTVMSRFTALLVLENDAMFREFNVVRAAKDTDRWTGKLPEPEVEPQTDATVHHDTPAGVIEGKPKPDQRSAGQGASQLGTRGRGRGSPSSTTGTAPAAPQPSTTPAPPPSSASEPFPAGPPDPRFEPARDSEDDQRPGDVTHDETELSDAIAPGATGPRSVRKQPAAKQPRKSKKRRDKSATFPRTNDPFPEPLAGLGRGAGGKSWHRPRRPIRRLRVRKLASSTPGSRSLARIERLVRAVEANPTKRSAHSTLVRTALRIGHPGTTEFAQAWAQIDPDHPSALNALADSLARAGHPLALRAYESSFELRPFSRSEHERMAAAYANKGDLARSCSHRRAVVSIDPSRAADHGRLAACLRQAGHVMASRRALSAGERRATQGKRELSKIAADLDRGVFPGLTLDRNAQLRATVSWTGEDDLDIAVVDHRGRRLSATHPQDVRVIDEGNRETLTMRRVKKSAYLEITRAGRYGEPLRPVTASVTIRTSSGSKATQTVTIDKGTVRIAKVFWTDR